MINDHLAIAQETGAEYCHLGQEDFFDGGYTQVSQLSTFDSQLQIGLSTHAPAQAERALAAKPNYIAIEWSPATGTKPTAKPVTLEYVRWAAANVTIPWFAIGGINLEILPIFGGGCAEDLSAILKCAGLLHRPAGNFAQSF